MVPTPQPCTGSFPVATAQSWSCLSCPEEAKLPQDSAPAAPGQAQLKLFLAVLCAKVTADCSAWAPRYPRNPQDESQALSSVFSRSQDLLPGSALFQGLPLIHTRDFCVLQQCWGCLSCWKCSCCSLSLTPNSSCQVGFSCPEGTPWFAGLEQVSKWSYTGPVSGLWEFSCFLSFFSCLESPGNASSLGYFPWNIPL